MEIDNSYNQTPRIGDQAPNFVANTTKGEIEFNEFAKDKWILFFSHPADFTPVCTTEMCGFADCKEDFKKLNTELLGLSIDSIHSHLGWINNIKEKIGTDIDFPIITDSDMKISNLYGMLHPNSNAIEAVRAIFFIDPSKKIRLNMNYPSHVGRNMNEIIRVLKALQYSDKYSINMPLNWEEGDKIILPAPKTVNQMQNRLNDVSCEKTDFYLCKKDLNAAVDSNDINIIFDFNKVDEIIEEDTFIKVNK
jgi:peroxiredoxin (alkyl hydroperoxide reductase subunit C)